MGKRLSCALLAAALAAPAPAGAQAPGPRKKPAADAAPAEGGEGRAEAAARFQRGLELYEEGDFRAALSEFRKAYELAPSYKFLYNIGQVCYQLKDYPCALRSLRSYLSEGGARVPRDRRASTEQDLARLADRVAQIDVVTNVDGAEVFVDDVSVGKAPLPGPVLVGVGQRKLSATFEGRVPVTRQVEVTGGVSQHFMLELGVPADPVLPEAYAKQLVAIAQRPKGPRMVTLSWVGLGVAGAFGAGALVTGLLARGEADELQRARFVGQTPPGDLASKSNKVSALALSSDLLTGAAVLTAAGTLVWTFALRPKGAEAAAVRPPVAFELGPASACVRGHF
jgi:hypothetical protein